ncbi:MAG: TolC family protein [Myxococcales bacterium]|nr:TolC family protein [Myxococcales bacterium]
MATSTRQRAKLPRWVLVITSVVAGCSSASRDRGWLNDELTQRTGHGIRTAEDASREPSLPPGVALADGLDEDEAVALALWSSPAFRADVTRLRAASADYDAAVRVENPSISAQAPIGSIKAAVGLLAPITSLLQRPRRKRAAALVVESVAESLVQSGLDLARDVRLAHIERALAGRRVEILVELETTARELVALAEARSTAGDVSPADVLTVRADARVAADAVAVARREQTLAGARLLVLLGRDASERVEVVTRRALPASAPSIDALLPLARGARPDVRAAELELEGAAARAGWERARIMALALQTDIQWDSMAGGARVGGRVELPIFNQNQGGVRRAEADVERARHRVDVVRQRVGLEVLSARAQLEQSLASRARYRDDVTPPLERALEAATQRYELGEDSYLVVLDALRRLGAARLRAAELDAEVRRAHAELERAVGARLEIASLGAAG